MQRNRRTIKLCKSPLFVACLVLCRSFLEHKVCRFGGVEQADTCPNEARDPCFSWRLRRDSNVAKEEGNERGVLSFVALLSLCRSFLGFEERGSGGVDSARELAS